MRAALIDDENKIMNIITLVQLHDIEGAKFLSDKSLLKKGDFYDIDLAHCGELPPQDLIAVVIDNVSNVLSDFDDRDSQYTVNEGENVIATGSLKIPNQKFRVPFKRIDTGRTQLMVAEVDSGQFTLTMNFKTSGIWLVNNELINSELPQPIFSINEYRFAVI